MGTFEYDKQMAEIDGKPELKLPDGVTHISKDFRGPDNEWSATVYFKNGVPISVSYYMWLVSGENLVKGLNELIPPGYSLSSGGGGNGHYSYSITPDPSEKPKT